MFINDFAFFSVLLKYQDKEAFAPQRRRALRAIGGVPPITACAVTSGGAPPDPAWDSAFLRSGARVVRATRRKIIILRN